MRVIYTSKGMSKKFGVRVIHKVRVIYRKIRYLFYICFLLLCVLLAILRVLCFCIVLCIVSPHVYGCYLLCTITPDNIH